MALKLILFVSRYLDCPRSCLCILPIFIEKIYLDVLILRSQLGYYKILTLVVLFTKC